MSAALHKLNHCRRRIQPQALFRGLRCIMPAFVLRLQEKWLEIGLTLPDDCCSAIGPSARQAGGIVHRLPTALPSYTTPWDVSGDIATNPDEVHDTTWGMAGVPYIAMASSQVSAGRFVGFSVTAPVL